MLIERKELLTYDPTWKKFKSPFKYFKEDVLTELDDSDFQAALDKLIDGLKNLFKQHPQQHGTPYVESGAIATSWILCFGFHYKKFDLAEKSLEV